MTASNDFLWTYILIAVLIGCALWFTLRSRGVQFRMIGEMFRLLDDYRAQRRAGRNPVFHRSTTPELDLDCWE